MDGRGSVHKLLQKQLTEVTRKDAACWNERLFVDLIFAPFLSPPKKNNTLKYQLERDLPKMSSFIEIILNMIYKVGPFPGLYWNYNPTYPIPSMYGIFAYIYHIYH